MRPWEETRKTTVLYFRKNGKDVNTFMDAIRKNGDGINTFTDAFRKNGDGINTFMDAIRKNGKGINTFMDAIRKNGNGINTFMDAIRKNGNGINTFMDAIRKNENGINTFMDAIRKKGDGINTFMDAIRKNQKHYYYFTLTLKFFKTMINEIKLFGSLFNDKDIIDSRLILFTRDHVQRLTKGNVGTLFTANITTLTNNANALETEVGTIDTSENIRTGQTQTVDEVTAAFSKDMSELEGVIARAVGGFNKPAMLEFYPHGVTEYNNPSREDMVILTDRIYKAASKYATQLGTTVTAILQGYKSSFVNARTAQVGSIADVGNQRAIRGTNRITLETSLTMSVHFVGTNFPTDVNKCASYFNFNLLYNQSHRPHDVHSGAPAANATATVVNKTLKASMDIIIKNTGMNANIVAWLAATATDAPNANAVTVLPGKSANIKATDLGDLSHTFLLLHNASTVNAAAYEVTIIG
jgi:hypothetical protein